MPSQPRRATRKVLVFSHRSARSARSGSSDAGPRSESHSSLNTRSTKSFGFFWKRRRTVTPSALCSFAVVEQQSPVGRAANDANDHIVFLNNPTEFDLRSYFFKRRRSGNAIDRLERSAISQSSFSRRLSNTQGLTSADSFKEETLFTRKVETRDSTAHALTANQSEKPRRRLRAKEELCIVLPRCTTRGRTRSQRSWFLGPGFIGRDPGGATLVVTKDTSMDTVHAEISVAGDDYFVRDAQSTMGTFLCLSTRHRHFPQRDGFRLCQGDVFRIGPATTIRVLDLQTTAQTYPIRTTRSSSSSLTSTVADQFVPKTESDKSFSKLERASSTNIKSGDDEQPALQGIPTVEKLRLLAADIEEELLNDACRKHSRATPRNEIINSSKDSSKEAKSARTQPRRNVQFTDTPPMMSDGSVFLGSRYLRPEVKELHYQEPSQVEDAEDDTIKQLVGSEYEPPHLEPPGAKLHQPVSIRLAIFQHDPANASAEPIKSREAREVTLPGQATYLIGSSAACDVRIFPSEGIEIRAVHARIHFDGTSFVLQDVSFERDPRRQTRVLLTQRPVRVTRGDWILLGKCALYITSVTRAFGSERRPDMKEAAMRLDVLRLSKRKPRTRGLFVPVGFRLHSLSGSGASSGSSGWGGSSGGPVTFGKGRDCDAQVFTASLATEQFGVQLERGTCLLTPKPTGINAGTYFLTGRDESGPTFRDDEKSDTDDTDDFKREVVKLASKPLLLSEGCVFRCGGCEVEVVYSKIANAIDARSIAAVEEIEHIRVLSAMPWLKPIDTDVKLIANVARCGERLKLDSGDVVYERGDPANFVFIVISGEVALHINDGHEVGHDSEMLIEQVAVGGYFGEVSLLDPLELYTLTQNCDEHEYPDAARASSSCELLVLARDNICGYLGLHMDIIRAHLRYDRGRDRIIRAACTCVPRLRGISLQEMRLLSSQAEVVVYPPGATLFEDGKLFVPAAFAGGNTFQLRDGFLVLIRGDARVVRSKRERQQRRNWKIYQAGGAEARELGNDDEAEQDHDEWWSSMEPVLAISSSSSPSGLSVCNLSFRLEASSTVECYFVAAAHLAQLNVGVETKQQPTTTSGPVASPVTQTPPPSHSLAPRRLHHSQVVTSALHSGDSSSIDDDDPNSLDGSDGEGDNTAARRWRRKKRNKQLLEQTILETQNDAHIPNAMVLYVLAGAQRGDIHVVRNVATVGGFLSGADIELNDRYVSRAHAVIEYNEGRYWLYDAGSKWGTFVRLEEDNSVDINPGDVFLAGEVEFTCLASYPERNKPSMCCLM